MRLPIAALGLLVLLIPGTLTAQTPAFLWAKSAGGTSSDVGIGIAVDVSGNSYVTGFFNSATITFGSTTLTNAGGVGTTGMYMVKISAAPVTAIDESPNVQPDFRLSENYPNPFNPSTKISYSIPKGSNVSLIIYDVLGREVERLVRETKPPSEYAVTWKADVVPSGVYFYRLIAGEFSSTKKMMLIK